MIVLSVYVIVIMIFIVLNCADLLVKK